MAKDFWDKFKISSDALKANWPMILVGLTALSSGIGNITQTLWLDEADTTNNAMKEYIEYTNKEYVLPKASIVTTSKMATTKSGCGECIKRIEKLERWH